MHPHPVDSEFESIHEMSGINCWLTDYPFLFAAHFLLSGIHVSLESLDLIRQRKSWRPKITGLKVIKSPALLN